MLRGGTAGCQCFKSITNWLSHVSKLSDPNRTRCTRCRGKGFKACLLFWCETHMFPLQTKQHLTTSVSIHTMNRRAVTSVMRALLWFPLRLLLALSVYILHWHSQSPPPPPHTHITLMPFILASFIQAQTHLGLFRIFILGTEHDWMLTA